MEDPMTYVNKMNQAAKHELILRKASLPLELVRCSLCPILVAVAGSNWSNAVCVAMIERSS